MRGDSDKKIHSCADVLTKEAEEEGLSSSTAAQTAVLFSFGGEVGLAKPGVPPFPPLRPTPVFDPINMQDFIFLPSSPSFSSSLLGPCDFQKWPGLKKEEVVAQALEGRFIW